MLSSENLYSVKFFDYNAINRMKLSTVTDLTEHSYTATTYAYDGFGRRTLTQTEGHTANRTLYDSTGFEILRQGTADSNGSFVNYTEAQNRYSPYYPYSGGGYYGNRYGYADYFYYLFFGGLWGFGAGGHGSKNGQEEAPEYLTIENMYPLYANGTVAGTHKEDLVYSPHKHYWNSWTNLWGADTSRYDDYATYKETLYFGTDVLGSVRTTSSYSVFDFGSINYDVFGSPYRRAGSFLNSESLDFGYLGKPYNATTELYDYGFRDYYPRNARFTTVDPIRDGRNWYTYVLNDPVNFIDLYGLAHFGKRPMNAFGGIYWPKIMNYTPGTFVIEKVLDKENVELCHEQLFFDDGSGDNYGFGWSQDNEGLFSETNIDDYVMDNKYYDDNLIRKAMENVETKKYSLLGSKNGNELDKIAHIFGKNIAEEFIGDGEKYNCQDWASDVRKEYKKLYKELSKEEKKIIKDVEKEWKKAEKQKKIQGDNKSENTCKKNNK